MQKEPWMLKFLRHDNLKHPWNTQCLAGDRPHKFSAGITGGVLLSPPPMGVPTKLQPSWKAAVSLVTSAALQASVAAHMNTLVTKCVAGSQKHAIFKMPVQVGVFAISWLRHPIWWTTISHPRSWRSDGDGLLHKLVLPGSWRKEQPDLEVHRD